MPGQKGRGPSAVGERSVEQYLDIYIPVPPPPTAHWKLMALLTRNGVTTIAFLYRLYTGV